ncbi:MAG: Re/Si-specific NAD(P)(+) transhydrogenase subunit alpha [Candidatus Saccharimonas sp.]|nr:Re/Si-specific NAD(P)(+) transhydrogenase subunit alpha [Planctomycetaceae bacterium]
MSDEVKSLTVGVPRETYPGERRVALIPSSVTALKKAGVTVILEAGAGTGAGYADADYSTVGAQMVASRGEVFAAADVILQVRAAGANRHAARADFDSLRAGQSLIGLCDPFSDPKLMEELAGRNVSCFALELLPRITRAQSMDVLSSMASIAGYKAVILAANLVPKIYPMMMTAAGTITAAKVFIIGAGVAGLQAIATARRLGAVVKATDVRSAAKENVLSLGAKFVDMGVEDAAGVGGYAKGMDEGFYRRQQAALAPTIAESDVIITTAAVPGKKAPLLISADAVRSMSPGSLVVDLAAEQGGNCELTKPGETIVENGVSVIGCVNLPSTVPFHASQMFSRNVTAFLLLLVKEGRWAINRDDEIVQGTLVTADGQVVHPKVRELLAPV